MTRLTLDIRSMPSKKKGRNGPGKTAATEQQAPLLQNTTEAFGAPTESTCEATVTAAPRSKGSGPGNAAATQHQAPLLQNAAEANGAPAESCKATVTRAAPASSVHEHAGAGPFLKPVASTLAPEFSSSELLQRYVEAGTSEQQQPQAAAACPAAVRRSRAAGAGAGGGPRGSGGPPPPPMPRGRGPQRAAPAPPKRGWTQSLSLRLSQIWRAGS